MRQPCLQLSGGCEAPPCPASNRSASLRVPRCTRSLGSGQTWVRSCSATPAGNPWASALTLLSRGVDSRMGMALPGVGARAECDNAQHLSGKAPNGSSLLPI